MRMREVHVMLQAETLKQWLQEALPGAAITVEGDDGRHFSAKVISEAFNGLSMLAQHRLVYEALGDKMHSEVHALSLETHAIEIQSEE